MKILIGSTNPVKLEAVKMAVAAHWPDAELITVEAPSGVAAQPMSDEETRNGAVNRAQEALLSARNQEHSVSLAADETLLGVGLEGGVFTADDGSLWSTVWAAVTDQTGAVWIANGGRIPVPQVFAEKIRTGQEMGDVVQKLTGERDVRKKQGMFGILTQNFVDRAEGYAAVAKLALGLWSGRGWTKKLLSEK